MCNHKKCQGVSMVEMLMVTLLVSILTALGVVMYTSQSLQARRTDGIDSLNSIFLAQEQYRSNNLQYGTLAQVWGGVTASTGGYYTLSVSNATATGYTLTATAQSSQANDVEGSTSCATLQLAVSSGTVTKTPSICWPQ